MKHKSYFDLTPETRPAEKPQALTFYNYDHDLEIVKADANNNYARFVKMLVALERAADDPRNEADQDNYLYLAGLLRDAQPVTAYAPIDTGESLPQLTFAPAPDQQLRMF